MPKCKNNLNKSYKGTEPSPKGLGWCAGSMTEGDTHKGLDKNMWIVKKIKNGNKRWMKHTTSKTKSKTKSKRKTKSKTKSTTYDPKNAPVWKKAAFGTLNAIDYMLFGKTTYLDADKPLYIRITPEYYTMKGEYDTKKFTFTKKNNPSNKDIVKFYKKFMLNKRKGLSLKDYLDLTHFKLIDVYMVGNNIEYKFKCMSCIHPTNGHILTPDRIPAGEVGFLTWKRFVNDTLPDGFHKRTTSGDPIKFIKVDNQQVYVGIGYGGKGVQTYQK